jgi:hypothetical protein
MTENGWSKERKIDGEQGMLILVTGGEGGLKKNLLQMNGSLHYILFMQPLRAT